MLDEQVVQSLDRQVPLILTATLYACLSILLSLGLTVISHHNSQYEYTALVCVIAATLIEISFFTKRALHYIPMLWIWLLWLALRIINTYYLNCESCQAPVFSARTYQITSGAQFLASLLTFVKPLRHPVALFVLAVGVAAAHTVPSHRQPDEWTTVLRMLCFVLLYYLSLVVTACYSVVERRSNTGVVKVLQSQWCLFVNDPYMLFVAAIVQGLIVSGFIFLNSHNLEHARFPDDGVQAHTGLVDDRPDSTTEGES